MSGSSRQLTLKKGAPGDQMYDLLCMQLASYLKRGPPMCMMPLHVYQKSDYDDMNLAMETSYIRTMSNLPIVVKTPLIFQIRGLGEGPKGKISFKCSYKVNSKMFKPNFVCLLTNKI